MAQLCGSVNPMSEMICVREPDHTFDHEDALGRYWSKHTNVVARSEYNAVVTERDTLAAEVRRLREIEERVERLLAECDRNEAHIRAHVPHLPPDGGSFSVHVIRKFLRTET